MYRDNFKDFEYKEKISFNTIKSFFNNEDWDVGYLSEEHFKKCALSPVKQGGGYKQYCEDYSNDIFFNKLTNAIVLIRKGHTWDYTLYEEIESIILLSGIADDCKLVYTHYKESAILSGLGVRARNSLIYSYKFGFDCHIAVVRFYKEIIDTPTHTRINYNLWKRCEGCDDCAKACPVGAIHNEGNPLSYWVDSTACIDFLTYGNHPTIPSIKTFWHKNVYPEIPKEEVDKLTSLSAARALGLPIYPQFDNNGYTYNGDIVKKDGIPVDIPICRECTSQPMCSKWGGKYPYDTINKREELKVVKIVRNLKSKDNV